MAVGMGDPPRGRPERARHRGTLARRARSRRSRIPASSGRRRRARRGARPRGVPAWRRAAGRVRSRPARLGRSERPRRSRDGARRARPRAPGRARPVRREAHREPRRAAAAARTDAGRAALAHFFGRDWVSVEHRPAAWVGFAHDATTRRTLFEAFVAVRTPFTSPTRPASLGKAPGTLEETLGVPIEAGRIVDAIVNAYVASWAVTARRDRPVRRAFRRSSAC